MRANLTQRLRAARDELTMLAAAFRHPRTPWHAKAWLLFVVAYAVSPIDLIPDFIPVLGLLDDAILLPLGIVLAIRMIPADVIEECRSAPAVAASGAMRAIGIGVVVAVWIAVLAAAALLL